LLDALLSRLIRTGALVVTYDDGRTASFGDGSEPAVRIRLTRKAAGNILADQALGLGEAYMDGDLVIEDGDAWSLLELIGRNYDRRPKLSGPLKALTRPIKRRLDQLNDRAAARRNVAHHYDLSNDLYRRFLDADLQYSCAYFPRPSMTLEEAQAAKKAHIAAKLHLRPGDKVLDIGCGWGGTGLELARSYGAQVTGVTLSTEQLAVANERAAAEGLADRARFSLTDYRDVAGPFDRIVSVGMFEHVGTPNYRAYFSQVARLLKDDGVALIHSIGRGKGPGATNAFTRKYVFPGGYIPALSEVLPAVEQAGLRVADLEILQGWHYAETLRHWRERFMANRAWAAERYDERFCRLWEFYLASAEMGFRHSGHMVFQLQLTKRQGVVPVTRDYIAEGEQAALAGEPLRRTA